MLKKLIFISLIIITLTTCTKNFEQENVNPNYPNSSPSSTLLTSGTERTADILGSKMNFSYLACWSQQFAKIQYIDEDRYEFKASEINFYWRKFYTVILANLDRSVQMSVAEGNTNMTAVGQIMQCYVYSIMTDLWGDIPYTEALQGETNLTPKYDLQRDVYFDLIKKLADCNDSLGENKGEISGDIIYDGNYLKWKKLANSLLLRLYTRISAVEQTVSRKGMEEILSSSELYPIFTSSSDDAQVNCLSTAPYQNALYDDGLTRDDHAVSKILIDKLLQFDDPRISVYAVKTTSDTTYRGMENGVNNADIPQISTVSRIGTMFRNKPDAPIFFMQYSELMFIIAEASLKGWNTGYTAKDAYEQGITASMSKNKVPIGNYLSNPKVDFDVVQDKLEAIAVQKWIALFTQGSEAFAESRRTGYPSDIHEVSGSVYPNLGVPVRFPYPNDEFNLNNENVSQAAEGIDNFMFGKKMWWAK